MEIIGFAGSQSQQSQPSRTRALVTAAVRDVARQTGLDHAVFDLRDLGPSLGAAGSLADLAPEARAHVDRLLAARAVVVGSPVYKGSYAGLFKHLLDLVEPEALRGKPVLLMATGGGDRHALVIEHQLRPLFGFFEAASVPTGVYAGAADLDSDGRLSAPLRARLDMAVTQLAAALSPQRLQPAA
ncbi:MAG: NAD(P)H-dependent oxidoreductase [Defluviimonas sp.]|nr:NAD(P)H-dependent oxidoreductase [Defluviimonas sp.]